MSDFANNRLLDAIKSNINSDSYLLEDNFDVHAERIPDKYLRETNENILVKFIYDTKEDKVTKSLRQCLRQLNYHVDDIHQENHYPHEIDYNEILDGTIDITGNRHQPECTSYILVDINKKLDVLISPKRGYSRSNVLVKEKVNDNDYDGLIILFSKQWILLNNLKEIWNKFTTLNCPSLKNKPKIFIFQIMDKKTVSTDKSATADRQRFVPRMFKKDLYDTPSEADISLIVDKISYSTYKSKTDLLNRLEDNITKYGMEEHLHTLLSISKVSQSYPMHVSTMTKQFYFAINECEGLQYRLVKTVETTVENVKAKRRDKKGKCLGIWTSDNTFVNDYGSSTASGTTIREN